MKLHMATLNELKQALRKAVPESLRRRPLSDAEYDAGFSILVQSTRIYQDFIIPQLSDLLAPIFYSRSHVSVLEIGPGPKSLLGSLPLSLRRKVKRYVAFEPHQQFAFNLENWFKYDYDTEASVLPGLESPPEIQRLAFDPKLNHSHDLMIGTNADDTKFDVVLFCHSMYGMHPKRAFVERAIEMLVKQPEGGVVIVFHRAGDLDLDGLVCHQNASFPAGTVNVKNDNEVLDAICPFIAGLNFKDGSSDVDFRLRWREIFRQAGCSNSTRPDFVAFSAPTVMVTFNQYATNLPELKAMIPSALTNRVNKNPQARLARPALVVRPNKIRHIQDCVHWALDYKLSLTVIGGGHSGQCVWDHTVAIDMTAFNEIHIIRHPGQQTDHDPGSYLLALVQSGSTSGDLVRRMMKESMTVPIGARPSVGAGLWLQGGIGHQARLDGLACDSIVGAVLVTVDSGEVVYVGYVPLEHRPTGALRSPHEIELLWALKGAGTNFGVVVSVVFKMSLARRHSIISWDNAISSNKEVASKIYELDTIAGSLPNNCSLDLFLYHAGDQLHLGVTLFNSFFDTLDPSSELQVSRLRTVLGSDSGPSVVDSVGLFERDMYVSSMHGGHVSGKTSSFKRCIFIKSIAAADIIRALLAAVETRPSHLCYLHILHGGGAISDISPDDTAFGCRDWNFACVVTGVWARELDGTQSDRAAVQWVYDVVSTMRPFRTGVYGADLGPDPRDAALAAESFGRNRVRLAQLKHCLDPHNLLCHTCPLPKRRKEPKLIALVTGDAGNGKDHCARVWAAWLIEKGLRASVSSISDLTKREYAIATGADLDDLLQNRAYKEQHRPALTTFWDRQIQRRHWLPDDHFLHAVYGALGKDVLLITGMRDEAPVASFGHLVPRSKLIEIRISTSANVRQSRVGYQVEATVCNNIVPETEAKRYRPDLVFNNDENGDKSAKEFAHQVLLPFLNENVQRLANMVRSVPDFPQVGMEFRDVLNIAQQQSGLSLCTSLLESRFAGDWTQVVAVAACESGGFIFGSALATRLNKPLVLIREASKIPFPKHSVPKKVSYISSLSSGSHQEKYIGINSGIISSQGSVVVIDDVLATGKTICTLLQLLEKAGVEAEDTTVMVVAEFPVHRGRDYLRHAGFGSTRIQSLLTLDGT